MKYVGTDRHKRHTVVCIIGADGNMVAEERIEHAFPERFGQLLGAHAHCQAAFGSTMNCQGNGVESSHSLCSSAFSQTRCAIPWMLMGAAV